MQGRATPSYQSKGLGDAKDGTGLVAPPSRLVPLVVVSRMIDEALLVSMMMIWKDNWLYEWCFKTFVLPLNLGRGVNT